MSATSMVAGIFRSLFIEYSSNIFILLVVVWWQVRLYSPNYFKRIKTPMSPG